MQEREREREREREKNRIRQGTKEERQKGRQPQLSKVG